MAKMIEVEIDSVRVSLTNQQRIVILKKTNEDRYLPIWIGLYEAEAITIALQEIQVARPQTHDLLQTLIHTANARLVEVEIVSLSDDVFYGNLVLDINGDRRLVDCRPSDALALAARMHVPIKVAEDVFDQAGIVPEEDISDEDADELNEAITDGLENENLDVFENFLQNYDLDDLSSEIDEEKDEGEDEGEDNEDNDED